MLPAQSPSFKLSRPALAIMVAALLLAALLATLTIRNIRREERLMQSFLLHEGLTLIRTFEAGARTTMMHRMEGTNPLDTLVAETVKEPSVAYIRVVNDADDLIASSGPWPQASHPSPKKILTASSPLTSRIPGQGILEVAAPFKPVSSGGRGMMMGRWGKGCGLGKGWQEDRRAKVIYLGLHTREFDEAREVDIKHAFLLGGILFLAGSAGLYVLFLYQEMRVTRRTLTNMELYTENVIESMPAGLITLDTEGRVVSCNSRAEEITGKPFSSLRGKVLSDEIPSCPMIDPGDEAMLDRPFTCVHEDGGRVPVKVSTSVLHNGKGEVSGMVLILRDMREIIDIEQELEQSRRLSALGRMAAGIAHEIRNPLGTLRGFAQLFVRKFSDQPAEQEYARMMVEEVDRLNRTISALLQFSRPREPEVEPTSLNTLLARTMKFMADDFRAKGVEIRPEFPAAETVIEADADLLQQVVLNLLHNALDASQPGGRVTLGGAADHDGVRLWIDDEGHGMTPEDKARMFDPFFSTKKTGTGLGLAVVHQIVRQHHGRIEVDSAPERGTRVEIIFPPPKTRET